MELLKSLHKYKLVDEEVATVALKSLSRHLFYLTEENVVMALFSNRIDCDEKSHLAAKLLTYEKPGEISIAKPKAPVGLTSETDLVSLIGPKSWTIFHVLKLSSDWLENDPNDWERHEDYCEARDWVRTAKVVNDSCERAVKLIQDYCTTLTTDSELRRGLLKGV